MTDWNAVPFIDYLNAVDDLLDALYGIGTSDCSDTDLVAAAQENGETPEQFVEWIAEKYGLEKIPVW